MKLVREHINEKFTNESDPIYDLGIGLPKMIKNWLDKYSITNYTINSDMTIDVTGRIDFNGKLFEEKQFPDYIQFNKISGYFCVNWNDFHNMIGCPRIIENSFYINGCVLTSLEGIPKKVGKTFWLSIASGFTKEDIQKVCDVQDVQFCVGYPENSIENLKKYYIDKTKRLKSKNGKIS